MSNREVGTFLGDADKDGNVWIRMGPAPTHDQLCRELGTVCEQVSRLQARVAELEKALEYVEFGGCDGCTVGGQGDKYCTACGEGRTRYSIKEEKDVPGSHLLDCVVGKALGRALRATEDS